AVEHAAPHELLHPLRSLGLVVPRCALEERELELSTDHRCSGGEPLSAFRQPIEAPADDLADSLRKWEASVVGGRSTVDLRAYGLDYDEGVALAGRPHLLGEGRRLGARCGEQPYKARRVGPRQRRDRELGDMALAPKLSQCPPKTFGVGQLFL